jgi:hypothetical protein
VVLGRVGADLRKADDHRLSIVLPATIEAAKVPGPPAGANRQAQPGRVVRIDKPVTAGGRLHRCSRWIMYTLTREAGR